MALPDPPDPIRVYREKEHASSDGQTIRESIYRQNDAYAYLRHAVQYLRAHCCRGRKRRKHWALGSIDERGGCNRSIPLGTWSFRPSRKLKITPTTVAITVEITWLHSGVGRPRLSVSVAVYSGL